MIRCTSSSADRRCCSSSSHRLAAIQAIAQTAAATVAHFARRTKKIAFQRPAGRQCGENVPRGDGQQQRQSGGEGVAVGPLRHGRATSSRTIAARGRGTTKAGPIGLAGAPEAARPAIHRLVVAQRPGWSTPRPGPPSSAPPRRGPARGRQDRRRSGASPAGSEEPLPQAHDRDCDEERGRQGKADAVATAS